MKINILSYLTNTDVLVSEVDRIPVRDRLKEALGFVVQQLHD